MATFTTLTVPGSRAVAELARLRGGAPATGLHPVLLGARREFEVAQPGVGRRFDPAETLRRAAEMSAPELLADWLEAWGADPDPEATEQPGDWPDGEPSPGDPAVSSHLDLLGRRPHPEVVVGLFPVQAPWQVFAYLNWGAFNGCPGPAEHCALQQYWAGRYGAEVVAVTHDVVECTVERPPADRAAALELAWEHYAYCPDLVDQGTDTVARLAAGLVGARVWYFWWD